MQNKEKQSNCFKIQRHWKPLQVKGGNQPLDLVRAPKLANICHQFTRKGLRWTPVNQGCSLWRRSGAAGLPSLTRAEAWAAGRSLTWKTTWLHEACNLKKALTFNHVLIYILRSCRWPVANLRLLLSESFDPKAVSDFRSGQGGNNNQVATSKSLLFFLISNTNL